MSAYNTVSAKLTCPNCSAVVTVPVQFKYANTWQFHYEVGDVLRWGGNDIGEPGRPHVVVDGTVAGKCSRCGYEQDWDAYVHVERDRIARVENANGQFDFVKAGQSYIVLD